MSSRGFGSVLSAGAVVGAALGFYLVSLRVASERAALEEVETRIALTQREIRLLQTEIGTRGRLAQLERWNVKFIRLSAPAADQFVDGGFQLATLVAPQKTPAIDAPMVFASAPLSPADGRPKLTGDAVDTEGAMASSSRPVSEMIHVASYSLPEQTSPGSAAAKPTVAKPKAAKPEAATGKPPARPALATKPIKTATADPLAPLPVARPGAKGSSLAATSAATAAKFKDRVTDR